jgi:hypothetical protein
MSLRWREIWRLSGLYSVVALIFAGWGLVCGVLVYLEGCNQTVLLALAILSGGATAFPLWNYLSRARSKAEQTIWLPPFPATARLASVAATFLFTPPSTGPATPSSSQALTTVAQNVLVLDASH